MDVIEKVSANDTASGLINYFLVQNCTI